MFVNLPSESDRQNVIAYLHTLKNETARSVGTLYFHRRIPLPQIKINGVQHAIDADPQMPLLWAIRDIVGLTGTKFGCGSVLAAPAPSIWTVRRFGPA